MRPKTSFGPCTWSGVGLQPAISVTALTINIAFRINMFLSCKNSSAENTEGPTASAPLDYGEVTRCGPHGTTCLGGPPARCLVRTGSTCRGGATTQFQPYQLSGRMLYLPGNTHEKTDKILINIVRDLSEHSIWPACARVECRLDLAQSAARSAVGPAEAPRRTTFTRRLRRSSASTARLDRFSVSMALSRAASSSGDRDIRSRSAPDGRCQRLRPSP